MTNDVQLRAATTADAEAILAIEIAAFSPYRDMLDPPSSVFRETAEMVRAKMDVGRFIVALDGERVVGLVFYQREPDFIYLGRLSVLPSYQRRGIGAMLIDHVEQRARELGVQCVRLYVRKPLAHLRAMYERIGYQLIEERTHEGYTTPTFLVMEKKR